MNNPAVNWSMHGLNQPPTQQQQDHTAVSVPGTYSHGMMVNNSNSSLPPAPEQPQAKKSNKVQLKQQINEMAVSQQETWRKLS